ncbi:MAG: hypothetical protein Q4E53_10195 [Eubacteriales bacterium]|nr:hypothetical protein [Eubacteriales bacterium]
MKKLLRNLVFVFLCVFILCGLKPAQTHAQNYFEVKSSVNSSYKITLKWKKQPCTQIRIYRSQITPNGRLKAKLIKTLKGKTTSYTDKSVKKKIAYAYTVKAYKKVNGKLTLISSGDGYNYCGLIKPEYDDYFFETGYYTTNSINLKFGSLIGMSVNGYQVQRKIGTGSYKTIKTFKTTKRFIDWTNTGLTCGKDYTYRIRSYKKIGKKTIYSNWSTPYKRTAALRYGVYTASALTIPTTRNGMFSFSFKASPQNAAMNFTEILEANYPSMGEEEHSVQTNKITIDGKNVNVMCPVLNAGSTMAFEFSDGNLYDYIVSRKASYSSYGDITAGINFEFRGRYNGTPVYFYYTPASQSIEVYPDDESIY